MTRVLLLVPPSKEGYVRDTYYGCWHKRKFVSYSLPPLMLYYLHALLPDSVVVDAPAHCLDQDGTLKKISSLGPDIVAASLGSFTVGEDGPFLRRVREEVGCRTVVFGEYPTTQPEAALDISNVVIRGEPEAALPWVAAFISSTKGMNRFGRPLPRGVCTRGRLSGQKALVKELDTLPFPRREVGERHLYSFPFTHKGPFTTLLATRGCPFGCIFCSAPLLYGRSFRKRSPENVVAEMALLEEQGFREVFFRDENLTLDRGFVSALCEEMLAQGVSLRWMANSRVDTVDEKTLSLMAKASCRLLKFGVESLSDETLKAIGKGMTTREVRKAFSFAEDAGIETVAHMMLGLPGETEQRIRENVEALLSLNPTYASFDVVLIYPGTELAHRAAGGKGTTLGQGRLETLHDWAFKRFYIRPRIMGKHLLRVGSREELFSKAKATLQLWRGLFAGR